MPLLRAPRALFRLPLSRAPIRHLQNSSNPSNSTNPPTTKPADAITLPKPAHKDIHKEFHEDPYDNSIHLNRSENTSSGTDGELADDCGVSFDPKTTRPEEELEEAGREFDINPLEYSPANREVSRQSDEREGEGESEHAEKRRRSGQGHPKKGSRVKVTDKGGFSSQHGE